MLGKLGVFLFLCATGSWALDDTTAVKLPQASGALRDKLLRARPDCTVVAENAAQLISRGEANETEVIAEWKSLCGENDLSLLYELSGQLDLLDANSPLINWNLWMILNNRQLHRSTANRNPEFHRLLSRRASSSSPHSADGKLLKTWFTDGKTAFHRELRNTNRGKLHDFNKQQREMRQTEMSMVLAANAGAWLPTGNLSRMGNHPSLGFLVGIGVGDWTFNMAMDFRFLNAPADYVYYDLITRSLQPTRSFFGLLLGFDVRWEFLKLGQFALLAAGALGYDLISHRAAPRYSGLQPTFSDSFNLNGGLVLRYYFAPERTGFVELDARAHKVSYASNAPGTDDLTGNYFTLLLAAGYHMHFDQ